MLVITHFIKKMNDMKCCLADVFIYTHKIMR